MIQWKEYAVLRALRRFGVIFLSGGLVALAEALTDFTPEDAGTILLYAILIAIVPMLEKYFRDKRDEGATPTPPVAKKSKGKR